MLPYVIARKMRGTEICQREVESWASTEGAAFLDLSRSLGAWLMRAHYITLTRRESGEPKRCPTSIRRQQGRMSKPNIDQGFAEAFKALQDKPDVDNFLVLCDTADSGPPPV